MIVRIVLSLFLAVPMATANTSWAYAQEVSFLSPDLSFNFYCKADGYPTDNSIERFLEEYGFRSLNKVRLQRENGFRTPMELDIVGLDAQRREINFVGLSDFRGTYSVHVYSPPPTQGSADLEQALLAFVENVLRCPVSQVERNVNAAEKRDLYDSQFAATENLFQMAEQLKHGPRHARKAEPPLPDDEIWRELIGSWTVPPDSPDYARIYAREVFLSDGTYIFYLYVDRGCTVIAEQVTVDWEVQDGVLISTLPDGLKIRDEILELESGRMTLHSLDDDSVYTRVKSEACFISAPL